MCSFYIDEVLTYDHVLEILGAIDTDVFSQLLREVLKRNVSNVLEQVEGLIMQGRELTQMVSDFTWYLRNLLLVKSSDNMEDVLDVSTENLIQLKEEAQMIESDVLLRYIRIFSELSGQMKFATQKRVMLEVSLIKLCRPAMEVNQDSLLDRIRAVEEQIEQGMLSNVNSGVREKIISVSEDVIAKEPKKKLQLERAIPEDVQEVVKNFRSIASETSGMLRNCLKRSKLSLGGEDKLLIVMPDELSAAVVGTEDHKKELEDLIEERIGKTITIEVRKVEEGRRFDDSFVDIEKVIHMDITIED